MKDQHKRRDWTAPIAVPKEVSAFFGKSLRNLNHLIQTTIGDPVMPAKGRGIGAGFSLQDIVLMEMGSRFLKSGFTPPRVRRCIDTIRAHWTQFTQGKLYREGYVDEAAYDKAASDGWVELYNSGYGNLGTFWVDPNTGENLPDRRVANNDGKALFVIETEHNLTTKFWEIYVVSESFEMFGDGPVTIFNVTAFSKKVLERWVKTFGITAE